MSFWALSALRTILDTETDANSPGSEELMSQLRENIEAILMLLLDTGVSGTATSDPSNDANGYFYDTVPAWTDDQHNGRTLLITSGAAKGNMYTIDDTVDGTDRLACTGDNLYADGVRSGDSYKILYDLKVNTDGHDHDGVNSPAPVLADNYIANIKLKTSATSASGTNAGSVSIGLQDYSFFPSVYQNGAGVDATLSAWASDGGDTAGRFVLNGGGSSAYVIRYRYVTASDEPFIYMVREKATGKILHCWMGDDPPAGFWNLSETPQNFVPPIIGYKKDGKPEFDPAVHEEIVCWKVKKNLWQTIQDRQKANRQKVPHIVIEDDFDYDQDARIWKLKNLITI